MNTNTQPPHYPSNKGIAGITHEYQSWYLEARHMFQEVFQNHLTTYDGSKLAQIAAAATNPGRRIRPALFFAFFKTNVGQFPKDSEVIPAVSIELFHTASIIIDDIIDHEERRRNKIPLHLRYDANSAILAAEYLIAKAFFCLSDHPTSSRKLTKAAAEFFGNSCVGEYFDIALDQQLTIMGQQERSIEKTVAFFRFLGQALNIELHEDSPDRIEMFVQLGKAFQISNDVIDLVYVDEGSRYDPSLTYQLNLSFLTPKLHDSGGIKKDELFKFISYERLRQISQSAKEHVGNPALFLHQTFRSERDSMQKLALKEDERSMAEQFLTQLEQPSFWLHPHETLDKSST